MSTLKADSQGFLIGQAIEVAAKELQLMRRIADDVRAIRRHLMGGDKRAAKASRAPDAANAVTPGGGKVEPGRSRAGAGAGQHATAVATPRTAVAPLSVAVAQRLLASAGAVSAPVATATNKAAGNGGATPEPRERDARGRFASAGRAEQPKRVAVPVAVTPGGRDERGRFTGGNGAAGERGGASLELLKDIRDRLGGLSAGGAEEVDPSVKAASEVAEVAAGAMQGAQAAMGGLRTLGGVVATPIGRLFGSGRANDAPTPWFRRLWRELRAQRREQSLYHRAELNVLKDIEAKPGDGRGGVMGMLAGLLGMLGTLIGGLGSALGGALVAALAKIPGLAMLGKLLPRVLPTMPGHTAGPRKPGLWTRAKQRVSGWARPAADVGPQKPGLLQRAKSRVGGWAAKAGGLLPDAVKPAGRLARMRAGLGRVPVLGAALAALGMGAGVYASESGGGTRAEKDKRTASAVGRGVGGLGGAVLMGSTGAKIGAALGLALGPVGVAIGAGLGGIVGAAAGGFFGDKAGDILGGVVGGWVTELRAADIPGKLSAAADAVMGYVTGLAEKAGVKLQQAKTAVVDKGLDVSTAAKRGYEAASGKPAQYTSAELARLQQNAAVTIRRIDQGDTPKPGLAERAAEVAGRAAGATERAAGQAVNAVRESDLVKGASRVSRQMAERWESAKSYLVGASTHAGVDPGLVAKIGAFESGFNPNAMPVRRDGTRISSAHGFGQFLDGTWTDMLNRHGSKYGVESAGKLSRSDAARYRNDKRLQAAMLAEFTRENVEKGRRLGGSDDDANVYAFHNLGDGDASKVLKALRTDPAQTVRSALLTGAKTDKERARVEAVIAGNKSLYGDGTVTVSAAYQRMGAAMRRGEVFAQDARMTAATSTPASPRTPQQVRPVVASASPSVQGAAALAATAQQAPRVPDAPAAEPVRAEAKKPDTVVVVPGGQLVGRDLPDRPMAHIVTGGYAARA